jgi:transcription antitermination protein NusB
MRASGREQSKARGAARRLAVQALYQWQLGRQAAAELIAQFAATPEHARADPEYFRAAVKAVCADDGGIEAELARHSDIEPGRLDPVEHAILALGVWELMSRPEVPYRVVINEGIELAKRFGATDGYRYVNAVLDRASRVHRGAERGELARTE